MQRNVPAERVVMGRLNCLSRLQRSPNRNMAFRRWLTSKRLSFPELIIENGSGLSTQRAHQCSVTWEQLLLAAFRSPVMPEFISSLPIAAVDGTMKKRLNGSATAGQAHIKTGLLEG